MVMRKWIIDRRIQLQLTQEDLARKTKLTRQAISGYETGNRGSKFGVPLLLKIAAALEMSMEDGDQGGGGLS